MRGVLPSPAELHKGEQNLAWDTGGPRPANERQVGGQHYKKEGTTQEHWDYCWEHDYNFLQYAASKYLDRYERKNGVEDLRKAVHYIEKLIEVLEASEASARKTST